MRQLAVISREYYERLKAMNINLTAIIKVDNLSIPLGIVSTENEELTLKENNKDLVLIKKLGFSLNYRDKSVIRTAWELLNKRKIDFIPIGSDFVGKIIDISESIKGLNVGDLVIPKCVYDSNYAGIPTNCASKEYQIFNKKQIQVIDSNFSIEKASVIGIGLTTAYSMIKKAKIRKGDKILVTSFTSNTSQFIIKLLKILFPSNDIYAVSFNSRFRKSKYVKKVFKFKEILNEELNYFNVVFDPFADTYLEHLIGKLTFGGRYITCGMFIQDQNFTTINLQKFIYSLLANNITLIGNCLGGEEDFKSVIELIKNPKLEIPINSIHKYGMPLQDFIDFTFSNKSRIGKVSYIY